MVETWTSFLGTTKLLFLTPSTFLTSVVPRMQNGNRIKGKHCHLHLKTFSKALIVSIYDISRGKFDKWRIWPKGVIAHSTVLRHTTRSHKERKRERERERERERDATTFINPRFAPANLQGLTIHYLSLQCLRHQYKRKYIIYIIYIIHICNEKIKQGNCVQTDLQSNLRRTFLVKREEAETWTQTVVQQKRVEIKNQTLPRWMVAVPWSLNSCCSLMTGRSRHLMPWIPLVVHRPQREFSASL